MRIRYAGESDVEVLAGYDVHLSKEELKNAVRLNRVCLAEKNGTLIGWLRYNLFWDNTPFINLLYIFEHSRGQGIGRQMVTFWEHEMTGSGYQTVMTSTQSNEYAQHFYFKLGYEAIGGFRLDGEAYEVIFSKRLRDGVRP